MHRYGLQWFTTAAFLLLTPIAAFAAVTKLSSPHLKSQSLNLNTTQTYIVKPGDTLWGIAQKLGVSLSDLIAWNDITNPNLLLPGQSITYLPPRSEGQANANTVQGNTEPGTAGGKNSNAQAHSQTVSLQNAPVPTAVSSVAQVLDCELTAYTAGPESTGKSPGDPGYDITASGAQAIQGITVAVDPSVIPLGTKLFIPGIGFRVAEDTGGAIIGDHIDVFFNDVTTARDFGVQPQVPVYILPNWFPMPPN